MAAVSVKRYIHLHFTVCFKSNRVQFFANCALDNIHVPYNWWIVYQKYFFSSSWRRITAYKKLNDYLTHIRYIIYRFFVWSINKIQSLHLSHHYSSWKILFFIFTLFSRIRLKNVFVPLKKKGHGTELEGKISFFSLKAFFSQRVIIFLYIYILIYILTGRSLSCYPICLWIC